ncbi:MAG TPA: caspase family protein [Bryobacteraceae bacterium]|nr:caspase family protein [Bryobacteraceae bacterium]
MNRAFLVGINAYPGNELQGCVNDVTDMADFLVSHCGFDEGDIRLLTDARATTSAILERVNWLLQGVTAGDRIVFHYSGHGAQFPVRGQDGKVTRVDECICPVDFDWTEEHAIRDKQFNELFKAVPKGVDFEWVSDSCFSGDLAREMQPPKRRIKAMPMPADIAWRMRTAETKGMKLQGFEHVVKNLNVVLISGCSARETSADAEIDGRFNGALTYYLLQTLTGPMGLTQDLGHAVARTRAALNKGGYSQHPQLEGSPDLMQEPFLNLGQKKKAAGA